jgi:hypothetical protein
MTRKTGWPQEMFLMQDDCSKLSRWFASRIDARETIRWVFRQKKGQDMTQDEIIEMARQAASTKLFHEFFPNLNIGVLEAFAKLAFEKGRQQGIKQERALWELSQTSQELGEWK